MATPNYVEGYKGTLTFEGQEFSVEAWSATFTANVQTITASKNGGWTTRRRGFKDMSGNCTILFETDVDTLTGTGLVPGSIGTLELIADTGVKFSGEFMIGDDTWNWVPGDVNKVQCNFGNVEAITTFPG
jgi:hypothetical protein